MIRKYSQLATDLQTTRSRPAQVIHFDKPLVGPSGAALIAYEWKYKWDLAEDEIEGTVEKRVSDWENADISQETGRMLVHLFIVKMPDGTFKTVSAETVPILLVLITQEQTKTFKNIGSAAKTLAKLKMEWLILQENKKKYEEDFKKVEKLPFPEITEEQMDQETTPSNLIRFGAIWLHMGDASEMYYTKSPFSSPQEYQEKVKMLKANWRRNRMKDLGWDYEKKSAISSYKEQDLLTRIKRQENKLAKITVEK